VINNLRGWLRGQGLRLSSGSAEDLGRRMPRSIAPEYVASQVECSLSDREDPHQRATIEDLAKSDELCKRLMTVRASVLDRSPFVAAIDDIRRFESAHQVEAYLGLAPGESSSSERQHGSASPRRPSTVRVGAVQAGMVAAGTLPQPAARPLHSGQQSCKAPRPSASPRSPSPRKRGGNPLRLLARRNDLRAAPGSRGACSKTSSTATRFPEVVIAHFNVSLKSSWLRLRPADGYSLCA